METRSKGPLTTSSATPQHMSRAPKIPEAAHLEEGVLGGLLIEKDAIIDVVELLKPSDFYQERHQLIYKAAVTLVNNSEAVDLITVANQLRKDGVLERVGNVSYLAYLTSQVAAADHIENHARIIVQYAMRRALIKVSTQVRQNAFDETKDIFDLVDKAEQSLFEVANENFRHKHLDISTLMHQAVQELEKKKDRPSGITGVPSGFISLDRLTLGWQPSDFVVVAGRPGMGKTSFMLALMRNASVDHQTPVAFFSLEMSSVQLVNRMIASEAGIAGEKIKKGNLQEYEWQQLYHKTSLLSKAPIYIDDTPGITLSEIRAKCRRLSKLGVKLVLIDYLQLIPGDGKIIREQQVSNITRSLKSLAKALDITIIAGAQLSRAVETQGGDKKPRLEHLRESGAIEQDTDQVLMLFRPEYYGMTQDDDGNDLQGQAEIILAKHRNGPTGSVFLHYTSETTRFSEMQREDEIMASKINAF
ncbi:MAG: replicative DNA helicase [Cytophagales bacterium]